MRGGWGQAFPVLSRILGENSLLNTTVGALVISAASVDEACVWCLLALVVSTVNAGSPLDAFYVFLLLAFFVAVMLTGDHKTQGTYICVQQKEHHVCITFLLRCLVLGSCVV